MIKAPIPKAEAVKIIRRRYKEISGTELKNKSVSIINKLIETGDFLQADKIFALAFEFQLFHRIEFGRKDILIDKIITERRIINTREN